ncbi:MAG TPA: selenide, water dikinase SelD [Steroidobacteraceae bacterium]
MSTDSVRLSSMAHGGGCGCKLSPAVLATLIGNMSAAQSFKQLLVGTETGDDAAVWQLDERTCLISTTDFFMPMVDDPRDFGRIAATNAISDIYAMGGRPIFALAILGMPLGKLAPERVREILEGGREVCQSAGIPVAGGHSIDTPEPIYGLAVNGICAPSELRRNSDAKAGDLVILTKPVGVGIYSAAFKKEALSPADYSDMLATMTMLNQIGAELGKDPGVHAMTDVTGFGVLGHALGMARGSGLRFVLRSESLPLLPRAIELTQQGFVTGASGRNWESYGSAVNLAADCPLWRRQILTDPQTSGGLLVACARERAQTLLGTIRDAGYPSASIIGEMRAGAPGIEVL